MLRYRMLFLVLLGVASMNAATTPPAVAPTQFSCGDVHRCKGPEIHGKHFALLTTPHSAVATSVKRWGDYVRIQLILSNPSPEPVSFSPADVVAVMKSGAVLHPAVVTEINEPSRGPGIMLGSGPATGYLPYVLGTPNPDSRITVDPVGDATNKLDKVLQQHQPELRAMMAHQLMNTRLGAGETIAGFVLVEPSGDELPVQVKVLFSGTIFALPATH